MFKKVLKGLTGQTYHWNKTKFRVQNLVLKNLGNWSRSAPDELDVSHANIRVIRNELCAGVEAVMEAANELWFNFNETFSKTPVGDFLVRDWFATLHLGAIMYAHAEYLEAGGLGSRDQMVESAFEVGLHGYSAMYEQPLLTPEAVKAIVLDMPGSPTDAATIYFVGKLTEMFGPPKTTNAALAHASALSHISRTSEMYATSLSWTLRFNDLIEQAKDGRIGEKTESGHMNRDE